jgi:ABC-type sugar transport system permease subunit
MLESHIPKERVAMSQATTSARLPEATSASAMGITALLAWQAVLGLALCGIAIWQWGQVFSGNAENAIIATIFGVVSGLLGLISLGSVPFILRRRHRGRMMALAVNYLVFIAVFFGLLNRIGFFVGLDDLADTFGRGLPLLAVVLIGYLLSTLGDGERKITEREQLLRRIGWAGAIVLIAIAIFLMGGINAVQTILTRIVSDPANLGLLGVSVAMGGALWFLWRAPTATSFNAKVQDTETLNGYLLLSPNLIGFLIFFLGPLVFSLYVSMTEWSAFGAPQWVGLGNYAEILSLNLSPLTEPAQRASEVLPERFVELTRFSFGESHFVLGAKDKLFWIALRNTLVFALMVVPLSVIPALILANILNSKIPGMKIFRTIYFIPSVAAVVGVAAIWNWLYNSTTGFINYGITGAVNFINGLFGFAIADPEFRWLSQSDTALLAIVIMAAWRLIGFNIVLFLAGLQGISREIYEAADVDGASTIRKFFSMTLPLLAPTTFFVVTTNIIQSLQIFDEVIVLINPPAGPDNATLTAVLYLYQNGFQRFNLGYASAVAWVLFGVIFIVTLIQFRIQRSGEAY